VHQVFTLTFGFQVTAVCFIHIGIQCAHVQQARNTGSAHHLDKGTRQVDVCTLVTAFTLFVQDAGQVDHAVHVLNGNLQGVRIVWICFQQSYARTDTEFTVPFGASGQHRDRMSQVGQPVYQV